MAYPNTLDGDSLYTVSRESFSKNANLLVLTMPRSDDTSTEVFDFLGVQTVITIEGIVQGAADIASFKGDFVTGGISWGSQDSNVDYVSNNYGTWTVRVENVTSSFSAGEEGILRYSMKLVVA